MESGLMQTGSAFDGTEEGTFNYPKRLSRLRPRGLRRGRMIKKGTAREGSPLALVSFVNPFGVSGKGMNPFFRVFHGAKYCDFPR